MELLSDVWNKLLAFYLKDKYTSNTMGKVLIKINNKTYK